MPKRIIILGGPRVGKTTLSKLLKDELQISTLRHSDDIKHLGWSEASAEASKWFSGDGEWICEGVQMARALRKWLLDNPDAKLDVDILILHRPFEALIKGQESMTKGVFTVFREIEAELKRRGARIAQIDKPEDALTVLRKPTQGQRPKTMLKTSYNTQEEIPENMRGAYVQSGTKWVLDSLDKDHPIVANRDELLTENATQKGKITKLTNEKTTLEGASLPAGHKAIPDADAEFIEKVKPFGSATEVVAKLTEHKALRDESDTRRTQDHLREVAKVLEYSPEAFVLLPNLPEFDIRHGADGKKTVIAKVKDGQTITEKPARELIESAPQYAPLLPALKVQEGAATGTRVLGSRSNSATAQPDANDLIAQRNQQREDARRTASNPLMARPTVPGAAALGTK